MPKTRGDLCAKVLGLLQAVGVGDSASPDDLDLVDQNLDPALRELESRRVIYVPNAGQYSKASSGEIDDAIFLALAQAVTRAVSQEFGGAFSDFDAIATAGEGRLRAMQQDTELNEPIRANYF